MSHAEKCPVCEGKGKVNSEKCHGCGGMGWVAVHDLSWQPQPYMVICHQPCTTHSPWQTYGNGGAVSGG